jgi:dihydrofolate reductase
MQRTLDKSYEEWGVPALWRAGVHVMGAETGRGLAAYWPESTEPYAPPINETPKVVFSKTLDRLDWNNTRIARGELAPEIERLKVSTDKDLLVHGGVRFVHSMIREGLVDEYNLVIHPVAVGAGLPFFPQMAEPSFLRLTEVRPFAGGAVLHVYRPLEANQPVEATNAEDNDVSNVQRPG